MELLRPIEGIDKIKVFLNPIWVDVKEAYTHPDPYNHLTLHQSGMFVSLAIHAEFLDPFIDYHMNIALAIHQLIKKEIIMFPDCPLTLPFIYDKLDWFISRIQEVEFYFDIKPSNITIDEKAVDDKKLKKVETSYCTSDYRNGKNKRKSIGIIYDKGAKDLKDNHIKHESLEQYPYKTRLEFRLTNRNCKYLNLANLRGTYIEIIKRFSPYLTIQYSKWFGEYVEITGRDNKKLKRIVKQSEDCGSRYRGKELKKSATIKIDEKARSDKGKKQMQQMIKRQFYHQQQEAEKDPE